MSKNNDSTQFYSIMALLLMATFIVAVFVGAYNDQQPIVSKKIVHKVEERRGGEEFYYLYAEDHTYLIVTLIQYTFAKEGEVWQAQSFEWQ